MKQIICMIGISGSGKTTMALEIQRTIPNSFVVSRDKIRSELFNLSEADHASYYNRIDLGKCESSVNLSQESLIHLVLSEHNTAIVDDTNLKLSTLNKFKNFGVPIKYVLVDTPLDTALKRNSERCRKVYDDVIKKQYQKLNTLKKVFDFKDWNPK